jgi:poly(hydroxyalkanoate) depolymerase family esterase
MWQEYSYTCAAGERAYFLFAPDDLRPGSEVPLLVMLHGCDQSVEDFAAATRMNQLASQNHFVVVYPQQKGSANRSRCWNWYKVANQSREGGEPAIIAGIVQALEKQAGDWNIDRRRIYLAGISAGGALAVILGATYPELFAAIGVHSGLEYRAATNMVEGLRAMRNGGPPPQDRGQAAYQAMQDAARAVPMIVFQGTRDRTVNSLNGDLLVQQWMQTARLASNGLYTADFDRPSRVESGRVEHGYSYVVYGWAEGRGRELQEYWKVDGLGHAWSGGSPSGTFADPHGPDASLAMYQFFMQHPLGSEEEHLQGWKLRSIGERLLKRLRSIAREPYN